MDFITNPITPVAPVTTVFKPLSAAKEQESPTQVNPMMSESFEKTLSKALEPVNALQLQSADYDAKLASGNLEYVHQAMVMGQKASLALDFTIQVRNKVVEAYQEIMRTAV